MVTAWSVGAHVGFDRGNHGVRLRPWKLVEYCLVIVCSARHCPQRSMMNSNCSTHGALSTAIGPNCWTFLKGRQEHLHSSWWTMPWQLICLVSLHSFIVNLHSFGESQNTIYSQHFTLFNKVTNWHNMLRDISKMLQIDTVCLAEP